MLDATGELIDEVGYEHLTTQQVARRSGVSIGLVYHYFPDRLALVEALIARNSERFMAGVEERLDSAEVTTWREALNAVLDVLIEMYRHEPGFCKIGLNDRFLTAQSAPVITDQDHLAGAFLALYRERYAPGGPERPDLPQRFEIAVQMGDALLGRAFRSNRDGEEWVLAEARRVLAEYLSPFLDRAPTPEEVAAWNSAAESVKQSDNLTESVDMRSSGHETGAEPAAGGDADGDTVGDADASSAGDSPPQ
ncbi:MAG: TetR/AcrR family transcriptional regulator [Acidimicrobiaceae bacterium]|nr:TetR/AcrR family transcriptional regulator [Acidimicrobiaceae bacterium]